MCGEEREGHNARTAQHSALVNGALMAGQGARLSEFLFTDAALEETDAEVTPHMHDQTCTLPEREAAARELASIHNQRAIFLYSFI